MGLGGTGVPGWLAGCPDGHGIGEGRSLPAQMSYLRFPFRTPTPPAPVLDQLSSPSAQCLHSPDPLGQALISMEPPKLLPLKLPTTSTHQENGNFSVLFSSLGNKIGIH